MYQKFNPKDWLPSENEDDQPKSFGQALNLSGFQKPDRFPGTSDDLARVVSRIEAMHTDITGTYADWRNLGFALADELGEGGRDYFHRLSCFYPKYAYTDCNRQFDQCLKSKGHGITIKTLFHMAKQAGVEIGNRENGEGRREDGNGRRENGNGETGLPSPDSDLPVSGLPSSVSGLPSPDSDLPFPVSPDLPTFPDSVYAGLPEFLKKVVAPCHTNEERDIMLLGAIVTLSSCCPNVFGIYDNKRVFTNLFLFITAMASAGKGNLVLCKRLVSPVHRELRKLSQGLKAQYEAEMREYNLMKMKDFSLEKPVKPAEKMLFIPANNSATGVFQLLSDNDGRGLIFETEGDTLAQAFKSDYGNYSDGFRKAFHHEGISYNRRTDREYVEIDDPCISTVMTSTPKQISALIPSAEDGLLSRFIFYYMNIKTVWKDVLASNGDDGLEGYYNALGQEFLPLYKALDKNPAIRFCVTDEQHKQFDVFFAQLQDKYLVLHGLGFIATVRRLGLIAFRIAMIFTTLRILETGDFSQKQVCSDEDFQAVLSMARVLVRHASHVYSELPVDARPTKPKDKKEQFLDLLPGKFTHQDIVTLSKSLAIHLRTAERYIIQFCDKGMVKKDCHGNYTNTALNSEGNEPAMDKG